MVSKVKKEPVLGERPQYPACTTNELRYASLLALFMFNKSDKKRKNVVHLDSFGGITWGPANHRVTLLYL